MWNFKRLFSSGDGAGPAAAADSGSLHGEMYRLELVEELLVDALKGYQGLIDAVSKQVPRTVRDLAGDHRKRLKQIRNLLDSRPTKPLLESTRQQLQKTMAEFGARLDEELTQQAKEAKQVMAIVAVMAESMASREKQYNVRFRGIGKKLRLLVTSNDLSEIRRKLEAEVTQLEKYAEEMQRDTEAAVSRVQMDLRQAKRPPATAQAPSPTPAPVPPAPPQPQIKQEPKPPSTVPAVAIGGRREIEERIEARRRADLRFCAARFSLRNLAVVGAQFGLPAAAGLLDLAGSLVVREFGDPTATVARWSDHDLVVIADLQLLDAAARVERLEKLLAGPYQAGNNAEVSLDVIATVIERGHGEPARDTMQRIESMLQPQPAAAARRPAPQFSR